MSGWDIHRTYISASVVKAMLLVAYLRKLHYEDHRGFCCDDQSVLYPMIHVSDNHAATTIWQRVGDGRLYDLAHLAGMHDFSISGIWANAHFSASDQARFMFKLDKLLPGEFRGYARWLLANIDPSQSWGIPHVQGRVALDGPRAARAPDRAARAAASDVVDGGADRRGPVDGLRDRDDRGRDRAAGRSGGHGDHEVECEVAGAGRVSALP